MSHRTRGLKFRVTRVRVVGVKSLFKESLGHSS